MFYDHYYYYQPTALEEAYGIYLLQTEFQIGASFHIAGRQAVPFFCRSGIDRLLLRNMWAVVDPHVHGYMSEPRQFYTFLRLTALAQTGPLQQMLAQASGVMSPEDVMRQCLVQTATVMLRLPVFEGIQIPSDLQNVYSNNNNMSNGMTPTPVPPNGTQQSSMTPQETEVAVLRTSLELTSIDDAFSALVQVEDKPLPSLCAPREEHSPAANTIQDDEDFGDFVDSGSNHQGSLGTSSQATVASPNHISSTVSVEPSGETSSQSARNNTTALQTTNQTTRIDMDASNHQQVSHTLSHGEVFGTFEGNQVISDADDFGDFASSDHCPIPTAPNTTFSHTDNSGTFAHVTSVGSNVSVGNTTIGSNATSSINMSISDAFEGVVPDRPVPSIDSAIGNVPGAIMTESQNMDSTIEFPANRLANQVSTMDACFTAESASKPVSYEVTQSTPFTPDTHDNLEKQQDNEDDKEFDDFASPDLTEIRPSGSQNANSTIESPNALDQETSANQMDAYFTAESASKPVSYEETQSTPFTPDTHDTLEKQQDDEDDTEFGDFASPNLTEIRPSGDFEQIASSEPATAATTTTPTLSDDVFQGNGGFAQNMTDTGGSLSGWDALDALSRLEDKPLPKLGTYSVDEDETQQIRSNGSKDASDNVEDDDFGEFVGDQAVQATGVVIGGFDEYQQSDSQDLPISATSPAAFETFNALRLTDTNNSQKSVELQSADGDGGSSFVSQPLAGSLNTAAVDDGDFGDFVSGDETDKDVAQSSAQKTSADDLGEFFSGDENGEKHANNVTLVDNGLIGFQQSAFQQQETSSWGSFDGLPATSLDQPLGNLASSTEKSDENGTEIFPSFEETASGGTRAKDEAYQVGESVAKPEPFSGDTVPGTVAETNDFNDFSGFATSGSADHSSFEGQSSPSDTDLGSQPPGSIGPANNTFDASNTDAFSSCDKLSSETAMVRDGTLETEKSPAQSQPLSSDTVQGADADDFGDFSGFTAFESNDHVRIDGHDGGPSSTTPENTNAQQAPDAFEDDSFGDFSGFESNQQTSNSSTLQKVNDRTNEITEDSDHFGDFASFESPEEPLTQNADYKNLSTLRDFVEKASLGLPEAIKTQSDGGRVDFANCFEANIGMEVPVSEARKKSIQRSIQIMQLLSHSKLASTYWQQAFAVTRDEISMALLVLEEAAGFTATTKDAVRPKLETYVAGLGEFVRVCRSIVATIGDLLMLHPSSLLTIDTLSSSWCSLHLLEQYLEMENGWRKVEALAEHCGLNQKPELETVSAIRMHEAVPDDPLCQFTLQPLSRSSSNNNNNNNNVRLLTKSPVVWNHRTYMACVANFLLHKCPSYEQSGFLNK